MPSASKVKHFAVQRGQRLPLCVAICGGPHRRCVGPSRRRWK